MRNTDMSDEHIKGSVSHAQGIMEQAVGTLIRDRPMQRLGRARRAQGSAQQGLGDIQDVLGGTRNGLNLATITAAVLGALLLVVLMRVVGGRPMGASSSLGAGI
jgi:uncharacterized protein YjbJ (UPF0337 family)